MQLMEHNGLGSCLACCECGISINYNALNMCEACMVNLVDITQSLRKQVNINHCFNCSRFLSPPSMWIPANNQAQLLNTCLKLVKGLNKYKVKDAKFLWTEPHSRRLKVELVIQQDVSMTASAPGGLCGGSAVEQTIVIEYTMRSQTCEECHREAAKDYWNASVQVRQRTSHQKTLYYMEQVILKFKAHKDFSNIKKVKGGVDFFFSSENNAKTFVQFLKRRLPCRSIDSNKITGHDIGNSTYNCKFTYCVEIVPVCKDDLVCLPKSLAQKLGNLNQLCLISRITNHIHLIDPISAKTRSIEENTYFQNPFSTVVSGRHLTQFLIVDAEICPTAAPKPGDCAVSKKHAVADAYVYRANEMVEQVHTRTHLGNIVQAGDVFLGIDMRSVNHNNQELDAIDPGKVPDVILVKKHYDRSLRKRVRQWEVERLKEENGSVIITDDEGEQQDFLEDIEEDPEMRSNINLYQCNNDDVRNEVYGHLPMVPLEEILGKLNLSVNQGEGRVESDAEMMEI